MQKIRDGQVWFSIFAKVRLKLYWAGGWGWRQPNGCRFPVSSPVLWVPSSRKFIVLFIVFIVLGQHTAAQIPGACHETLALETVWSGHEPGLGTELTGYMGTTQPV